MDEARQYSLSLFEQVCEWDNLLVAAGKCRRGKRSQAAVAAFEFDRERELLHLQDELRTKAYQPGPYSAFEIREMKRRLISAARAG